MRAPTVAAFLDFDDTRQLIKAVQNGEAPRPTGIRGSKREPVWARVVCEEWVARRHGFPDNADRSEPDDLVQQLMAAQ
jgi:hypothetical protein